MVLIVQPLGFSGKCGQELTVFCVFVKHVPSSTPSTTRLMSNRSKYEWRRACVGTRTLRKSRLSPQNITRCTLLYVLFERLTDISRHVATLPNQNYGMELEQVQQLYEKQKHDPPISRNLPPVAGNITWSRWDILCIYWIRVVVV